MKCDFCSAPNPRWSFPARDFQTEVVPDIGSEGGWAACDPCHGLIESGDWRGLTDRSYTALLRNHPEMALLKRQVLADLDTVHSEFRRNRTGSPRRLTVH